MNKVVISELRVRGAGLADVTCDNGIGEKQTMLAIVLKVNIDDHDAEQRKLAKLLGFNFENYHAMAKSARRFQIEKKDYAFGFIIVDEAGVSAPEGNCYDALVKELRKRGIRMFVGLKNRALFQKARTFLAD